MPPWSFVTHSSKGSGMYSTLFGMSATYGYYAADSSDPNLSQASAGDYSGFTNIYLYSKDGQPLNDVLLYDQNGQPILPVANGLTTDIPVGAD